MVITVSLSAVSEMAMTMPMDDSGGKNGYQTRHQIMLLPSRSADH